MTDSAARPPLQPRHPPSLFTLSVALGLDYLRWLALTPMITAWTFYLFMVVALVMISFQGPTFPLLERASQTYEQYLGPLEWREETATANPGETDAEPVSNQEPLYFSGEDIMPWVFKAWGILALAGWLLGMLFGLLFGPRPPRTLGYKLRLTTLAAILCCGLMFLAYFLGGTPFHGGFFGWFALFTISTLVVWLVTAGVLAIGLALDRMHAQLVTPGATPRS